MVKRTELGCAGHFICASRCQFRRHTQVGKYRVSTVGDMYYENEEKRQTLGAGEDSFFETMVFKTTGKPAKGNEGCGCMKVESFSEIDGARYATAGAAQKGHERYVAKYLKQQTKTTGGKEA